MEDPNPKISLISIALSDEELESLRENVKEQTYNNFEFVTITGDIPIPEAWNIGIERAEGEIIAFTESDVKIPDDWLENIAEQFKLGNDFVMGYEVQLPQRHQSMSSTAVRADWAKETRFNEDYSITEDTEWFARLMDKYDFQIEKTDNIPVVYHNKDRSKYTWAFYHGVNRAEIWLEYSYEGKSASGVTLRRIRRILIELVTIAGQAAGLVKHPIKLIKRFSE